VAAHDERSSPIDLAAPPDRSAMIKTIAGAGPQPVGNRLAATYCLVGTRTVEYKGSPTENAFGLNICRSIGINDLRPAMSAPQNDHRPVSIPAVRKPGFREARFRARRPRRQGRRRLGPEIASGTATHASSWRRPGLGPRTAGRRFLGRHRQAWLRRANGAGELDERHGAFGPMSPPLKGASAPTSRRNLEGGRLRRDRSDRDAGFGFACCRRFARRCAPATRRRPRRGAAHRAAGPPHRAHHDRPRSLLFAAHVGQGGAGGVAQRASGDRHPRRDSRPFRRQTKRGPRNLGALGSSRLKRARSGQAQSTRIGLSATVGKRSTREGPRIFLRRRRGRARPRPCRVVDAGTQSKPLGRCGRRGAGRSRWSAVGVARGVGRTCHERVGAASSTSTRTDADLSWPGRGACCEAGWGARISRRCLGKGNPVAAHHGALAKPQRACRSRKKLQKRTAGARWWATGRRSSSGNRPFGGRSEAGFVSLGSPRSIAVLRQTDRSRAAHHARRWHAQGAHLSGHGPATRLVECAAAGGGRRWVRGRADRSTCPIRSGAARRAGRSKLVGGRGSDGAELSGRRRRPLRAGARPARGRTPRLAPRREFSTRRPSATARRRPSATPAAGRFGARRTCHLDSRSNKAACRRGGAAARLSALDLGRRPFSRQRQTILVVEDPTEAVVGTLDEDFASRVDGPATSSCSGSHSWRIRPRSRRARCASRTAAGLAADGAVLERARGLARSRRLFGARWPSLRRGALAFAKR